MKLIQKFSNFVFGIEKALVAIFLFVMFASLAGSVIFRYFLNNPLHWAEETAIYSLAWTTFVGGSMTIKERQSAAISMFVERFSGKTYTILVAICNLIVFVFSIVILLLSIKWINSPFILFEKSSALQLPMIIPYLSVPVGFCFMTIHSMSIFLEDILDSKKVLEKAKHQLGSDDIRVVTKGEVV